MRVLGIKPKSSVRTTSVLNCWATAPAQRCRMFQDENETGNYAHYWYFLQERTLSLVCNPTLPWGLFLFQILLTVSTADGALRILTTYRLLWITGRKHADKGEEESRPMKTVCLSLTRVMEEIKKNPEDKDRIIRKISDGFLHPIKDFNCYIQKSNES